jgi:hypothetical protein
MVAARGIFNGLILSIPLWTLLIIVVKSLL